MKAPETRMNPDISKVDIGIRELKELTIYPLPAAFQLDLMTNVSGLLVDVFSIKFNELQDREVGLKLASLFIKLIQDNIYDILENAVDPKEMGKLGFSDTHELMRDIATNQFAGICELIYKNNYEYFVGKLKSLFQERMEEMGPMKEAIQMTSLATKDASPSSADTTEDTK